MNKSGKKLAILGHIVSLLLLFLFPLNSMGQRGQVLYGFHEIPQSLLLNPGADVNYRWFFGLPLLSGVQVNVGSSGFSVFDLFADDGVDFNTKLTNIVNNTSRTETVFANQQLEVFTIGFKSGGWRGKNYFSLGMYQELDFFSYWPRDPIQLAYYGNSDSVGRRYDLSDASAYAELLTVFHFGLKLRVNDKFSYGARFKVYNSIFNAEAVDNSGYFLTEFGSDNIYRQTLSLVSTINTSGFTVFQDSEDDVGVGKVVRERILFGGDLGLGLDFGFNYYPKRNWQISGSLLDIGFIHHTKETENYTVNGTHVYEGIELLFPDPDQGGTIPYWDNLIDAIEDDLNPQTLNRSYATFRPWKLHLLGEYSFGGFTRKSCNCVMDRSGHKNSVGAHFLMVNRPRLPEIVFTVYYYRKVFEGLRAKVTFTADRYSDRNIGLGVSSHMGNVNFYFLVDNTLEFQNLVDANALSVQFGFNYIFPDSRAPY